MNKIKSFCVDHRKLNKGIYLSRIDDSCKTYDLRFCKPNSGDVLSNAEIHTTEHMIATFVRNSKYSDSILYFGPMGCQTGFYLLVRDLSPEESERALVDALEKTLTADEMFGATRKECGNYQNLSLDAAKKECAAYLAVLKERKGAFTYEQ